MDIQEVILSCVAKDPRYRPQAYHAVRLALDHAQRNVHGEPRKGSRANSRSRHVTGPQVLEGFRQHCLDTYGPMTYPLLHNWGIRKTADVGNIVFNLIDTGLFGKSDDDRHEDFANVYDFKATFLEPFQPGRN
jgi:uncharacterized repeat protein (TIGR04138 family)